MSYLSPGHPFLSLDLSRGALLPRLYGSNLRPAYVGIRRAAFSLHLFLPLQHKSSGRIFSVSASLYIPICRPEKVGVMAAHGAGAGAWNVCQTGICRLGSVGFICGISGKTAINCLSDTPEKIVFGRIRVSVFYCPVSYDTTGSFRQAGECLFNTGRSGEFDQVVSLTVGNA